MNVLTPSIATPDAVVAPWKLSKSMANGMRASKNDDTPLIEIAIQHTSYHLPKDDTYRGVGFPRRLTNPPVTRGSRGCMYRASNCSGVSVTV